MLILIKMALCTKFGEVRVTLIPGSNKISNWELSGRSRDILSKKRRHRSLKSRSKVIYFIKELKILLQMEMLLNSWLKETLFKLWAQEINLRQIMFLLKGSRK